MVGRLQDIQSRQTFTWMPRFFWGWWAWGERKRITRCFSHGRGKQRTVDIGVLRCVNPDCNPRKVLGTHAHASAAEVKAEESSAFFGHESNRLVDSMDLHRQSFAHCSRSGSAKSSSEAFKRQALALHPDKGGSKEAGDVNTIDGSEINCGLGDYGKRSKAFQRALRAFEALVSDFANRFFCCCYIDSARFCLMKAAELNMTIASKRWGGIFSQEFSRFFFGDLLKVLGQEAERHSKRCQEKDHRGHQGFGESSCWFK